MSSKRRLRKNSCTGKKRFNCQDAMDNSKAASMFARTKYMAYKCKFCGWWHVGRPNQRILQGIRATRAARNQ